MLTASPTGKAIRIPTFVGMTMLIVLSGLLPAHGAEDNRPGLSPNFCHALVKHKPRSDVTYQDGVDLKGHPVVPADIEGQPRLELPEEISLPLTADLFHFLKLDQSKFPFNAMSRNDINLGTLTVRGDQVFYNGQPLTDAQQDNLAVLCLKPTEKP